MRKHELTNVELVEEDGQFYLHVTYTLEDDSRIEELDIPRVVIPFNRYDYPDTGCDSHGFWVNHYLYNSGEKLRLKSVDRDDEHNIYTIKLIKNKTHKMTVSEIEKKLGYKIEIVSEKERKNND